MTKQADGSRDTPSPAGMQSDLRAEAADAPSFVPSVASSGGEVSRCGPATPHPPTPATHLYSRLDWPVLTKDNNVFLICGQRVDIVSMASDLASEVYASMKMLAHNVPVLEVRGETLRWAFFCRSQPPGLTSLGALSLRGVNRYGASALFQLPPSPESNSGSLRWIHSPFADETELASIDALTNCVQTALRRQL